MTDMTPVRSTNIREVGYDAENRELVVTFRNGNTYTYASVGQEAYDDMIAATSPTAYLKRHIEPNHTYRKVRL